MSEKKYGLPVAPLDILRALIKEYARKPEPRTPSEVNSDSGISIRNITKSNTFLTDLELLNPGNKKSPTDKCKELARFIQIGLEDDEKELWKKIIVNNEFLSDLLSIIKTHTPIDKGDLTKRAIHKSGRGSSHDNTTGVNNIFNLLEFAGLIKIHEGNVHYSSSVDFEESKSEDNEKEVSDGTKDIDPEIQPKADTHKSSLLYNKQPSVVINLQLEIPVFKDPKDYEVFFSALRKNLIDD